MMMMMKKKKEKSLLPFFWLVCDCVFCLFFTRYPPKHIHFVRFRPPLSPPPDCPIVVRV